MLLRRFTQHIKDQNWFAVGVDLVVVTCVISLIAFITYTVVIEHKNMSKANSYCRYVMEIETARKDKFTDTYYCELDNRVYPILQEGWDNYGKGSAQDHEKKL